MTSPLAGAAQAAIRAAQALGATTSATLRRTTTTYTPSDGSASTTTSDQSWNVVLESYADRLVDGTVIQAGDRKAIGAAGDLTTSPSPDTDSLIIASTEYQIVRASQDPAGVTWELQLRR